MADVGFAEVGLKDGEVGAVDATVAVGVAGEDEERAGGDVVGPAGVAGAVLNAVGFEGKGVVAVGQHGAAAVVDLAAEDDRDFGVERRDVRDGGVGARREVRHLRRVIGVGIVEDLLAQLDLDALRPAVEAVNAEAAGEGRGLAVDSDVVERGSPGAKPVADGLGAVVAAHLLTGRGERLGGREGEVARGVGLRGAEQAARVADLDGDVRAGAADERGRRVARDLVVVVDAGVAAGREGKVERRFGRKALFREDGDAVGDVEPAAGDGLAGVGGLLVDAVEQGRLDLGEGGVGGVGGEGGDRAGDVRRGHARAAGGAEAAADDGGADGVAGRGEVDGGRAVVAEAGEGFVVGRGGDADDVGQRRVGRVERRDVVVRVVVAGGGDVEDAAGVEAVDGAVELGLEPIVVGAAAVGVVRGDDVEAAVLQVGDVVEALQDAGVGEVSAAVAGLDGQDRGPRRDAEPAEVVVRDGGDRAGDVSAVRRAVALHVVVIVEKVPAADVVDVAVAVVVDAVAGDLARVDEDVGREVGVRVVDAAVDDRDDGALPGRARLPGAVGVDVGIGDAAAGSPVITGVFEPPHRPAGEERIVRRAAVEVGDLADVVGGKRHRAEVGNRAAKRLVSAAEGAAKQVKRAAGVISVRLLLDRKSKRRNGLGRIGRIVKGQAGDVLACDGKLAAAGDAHGHELLSINRLQRTPLDGHARARQQAALLKRFQADGLDAIATGLGQNVLREGVTRRSASAHNAGLGTNSPSAQNLPAAERRMQ